MTATELANAPDPEDRLWKPDDLVRRWGVCRATIYNWCSNGYLPHRRLGVGLRFDPEETKQWEKSRNVASVSRLFP
jgi:hypothetical protein